MPKVVIHDEDGHVDDLLSTLLLWLAPEVDLQAVTITEGDCYVHDSYETLIKIATYLDLEGAEIAISEDAITNPFPDSWRRESNIVKDLPIFANNLLKATYQPGKPRKSQSLIIDCLNNSKTPVTICATGPLTNLADVFTQRMDLKNKVEEFVIMGGALKVPGNVEAVGHDGSAEWNFFADPYSAKIIMGLDRPIRLIPLDITNQLPLRQEFLNKLALQTADYKASKLASSLWSLVRKVDYYFWDTVTAAAIIRPELFEFKNMRLDLSTTGKSQGRIYPSFFSLRKFRVATAVNRAGFEELILDLLRQK